jgi:putative hydrolase of the HAD superfamily
MVRFLKLPCCPGLPFHRVLGKARFEYRQTSPSPGSGPQEFPWYTLPAMDDPAIKSLIFDLDDTLVVEETSAEAAFIETGELARARYGLDPHELHATLRQACREIWYAFPSHPYCKRVGISSWEGMWAEFTGCNPELKPLRAWAPRYRFESWHAALLAHKIDDLKLAEELAETFPILRRKKHVLYPDAITVLEQLVRKYSLGLLTNGAPDLQRTKIEGAGLGRYFDEVLISGETGFGKPDPRVFEMLVGRLGSSVHETLMIGDRLATDVQGAQRAGIRAVWINRAGGDPDGGIVPDWEISNLHELLPILLTGSAGVPPAGPG